MRAPGTLPACAHFLLAGMRAQESPIALAVRRFVRALYQQCLANSFAHGMIVCASTFCTQAWRHLLIFLHRHLPATFFSDEPVIAAVASFAIIVNAVLWPLHQGAGREGDALRPGGDVRHGPWWVVGASSSRATLQQDCVARSVAAKKKSKCGRICALQRGVLNL